MGPTDAELVARCLQDRDALHGSFRGIYDRHGRAAYRFLRAMVGADRADDCLQETFIRVFRTLPRWERDRPLRPWILAIARHVALDAIRRDARRDATARAHAERVAPAPGAGDPVGEGAAARELRGAVREAVARLPEEQREVFLLRQVEGLTFDEVAGALGCSVRTAKSRMKAAASLLAGDLRRLGAVGGA